MNRDTMMARWYRRVDPGCFTSQHLSTDLDGRPAMEAANGAHPEPETTIHAVAVSDHWPTVAGDRRGWSIEAAADRL